MYPEPVIGLRPLAELMPELVRAFANAKFSGEERHVRRLKKLKGLEARYSDGALPAARKS